MDAVRLENLADLLRRNGYVVIPRERRVVLTSTYILSPTEMRYSRVNAERIEDMAREQSLKRLIRQADDDGLILHVRQDIDDPVTGREIVFRSAMAVTKPKADDEV